MSTLLPTPLGGGDSSSPGAPGAPGQNPQHPFSGIKPKRTLIESACAACRKRKSKCDGQRPSCARCQVLKTPCTYEAQEGESRWSALRRRKKDVEGDRDDLMELITYMQGAPEEDALRIFHRIRANDFGDLLRLIRHAREDGHSVQRNLVSQQETSEHAPQRLPSIRAMLESFAPLPGQAQEQEQSGEETVRPRAPSMSSDGSATSAESYASNRSTAEVQTSTQGGFRPTER